MKRHSEPMTHSRAGLRRTEEPVGWPTEAFRIRGAEFQSAVTQVCSLQAGLLSSRSGTAEQVRHSRLPQIENLARQTGFMLTEALVYIGLVFLLLGIGYG